jgi:hypothetical protein
LGHWSITFAVDWAGAYLGQHPPVFFGGVSLIGREVVFGVFFVPFKHHSVSMNLGQDAGRTNALAQPVSLYHSFLGQA